MKKELTCIRCPIGCRLEVETSPAAVAVTGNSCPRGAEYGEKEVRHPTRMVTGSVRISDGELPLVSVKTESDVPKERIFDVMVEIHKCEIEAPVNVGDVVISNVAGTGVDIVATRTVKVRGFS